MHTTSQPHAAPPHPAVAPPRTTRVAIAGATGFTGQELLRLLARHPAVRITLATSSGAASAARRLPALAKVWDGAITPLDRAALAAEADLVFLALPDTAAAELAPALVEQGVKVIDLSGAFRLRDAAARRRWYPETC
jgi:N-acetyl-gamma-glutamyl-phosphate reductase